MSLEETKEDSDTLTEIEGFRFVMDPQVEEYLKDAVIDYQTSRTGGGFVIDDGKKHDGCC